MTNPSQTGPASTQLLTADGLRLFTQAWQPVQPRASVVIVHGYAEHSGRYEQVASQLASQGFAVYALDLRGHGQSEGERGLVQLSDFWIDLASCWSELPQSRPVFLLAHSMGSAVALGFLLHHCSKPDLNVAGLITTGTILAVDQDVPRWRIQLVTQLSRIWPRLPVAHLNSRDICRNPDVVRAYDTDPLVYRGPVRARTAVELFEVRHLRPQLSQLHLPALILHGTQDRLAPVAGSQRLYASLASSDKTLKLYDGLAHELLNEPERQQVLTDIITWLNSHLPAVV